MREREVVVEQHDAVRTAFEEHRAALLRLAVLLMAGADGAEDLVQEAFVRSARRLPSLVSSDVRPYLRTVVLNLWRNGLRTAAADRRVRPSLAPEPPATEPGAAIDDRDRVWRAIQSLPPRQRACLVLRFYEDLSERDTAAVMGCRVGTVKSQTSRALARLRKELEPDA